VEVFRDTKSNVIILFFSGSFNFVHILIFQPNTCFHINFCWNLIESLNEKDTIFNLTIKIITVYFYILLALHFQINNSVTHINTRNGLKLLSLCLLIIVQV